MKQTSLDLSLSVKKTRKREFLEQMGKVVTWQALIELIAPYYPEDKKGHLFDDNYLGRLTTTMLAG